MSQRIGIADLSAYLDDELPPGRRAAVEAALAADADLRAALDALSWTVAATRSAPLPPLPEGRSLRLPLEVDAAPRRAPRLSRAARGRPGALAILTAAAAVTLAVLARSGPPEATSPPDTASMAEAPAPPGADLETARTAQTAELLAAADDADRDAGGPVAPRGGDDAAEPARAELATDRAAPSDGAGAEPSAPRALALALGAAALALAGAAAAARARRAGRRRAR